MRIPTRNPLWRRRPYTRLFGVGDHWFRDRSLAPVTERSDRCAFTGCDRPRHQHWLEVGEWMLPRRDRLNRIYRRALARLREDRR